MSFFCRLFGHEVVQKERTDAAGTVTIFQCSRCGTVVYEAMVATIETEAADA